MPPRSLLAPLVAALALLVTASACSLGAAPAAGSHTAFAPDPAGVEQVPVAHEVPRAVAPPTVLPAALPTVFHPTCDNAPAGWLPHELAQRAVTDLPPSSAMSPTGGAAAYGYLDRTYVACGEPDALHLSARVPGVVVVEAIRVGDYSGHLGRVVWRSGPVVVGRGSATRAAGRTTEIDGWPTALVLHPGAQWPPGLYTVRITPLGMPGDATFVPLRVLASGTRSRYLAISSDLTELAYDPWGGTSLYFGRPHAGSDRRSARAYVASAHRPAFRTAIRQFFTMDVPLATFADHHGIALDWTADTALDADPSQVVGRAALILPGHSEYWTTRAYDALEVAEGRGTNLLVLGANELYWHARLTRDATGNVTAMTVVRSAALDTGVLPAERTVLWASPPLDRDGARLTGLHTAGVGIRADGSVVSGPAWLLGGTGLAAGTVVVGVFGNEGDGPEGRAPRPGLEVLISGRALDRRRGPVQLATAYFRAPSGAGVFSAGSTEWLCAITNTCSDGPRPTASSQVLDRVTLNALAAFARPRAGAAHPVSRSAV